MEKYKPSLARLKRVAQKHPNFLAHLFSIYQQQNEQSDEQLAMFLECDVDVLPELALCQRPTPIAPHFRWDVESIAQQFHANATRLAQLIRNAEAYEHLSRAGEQKNAFLLAARDREGDGETNHGDENEGL